VSQNRRNRDCNKSNKSNVLGDVGDDIAAELGHMESRICFAVSGVDASARFSLMTVVN
jgi:hypothetical protein